MWLLKFFCFTILIVQYCNFYTCSYSQVGQSKRMARGIEVAMSAGRGGNATEVATCAAGRGEKHLLVHKMIVLGVQNEW